MYNETSAYVEIRDSLQFFHAFLAIVKRYDVSIRPELG